LRRGGGFRFGTLPKDRALSGLYSRHSSPLRLIHHLHRWIPLSGRVLGDRFDGYGNFCREGLAVPISTVSDVHSFSAKRSMRNVGDVVQPFRTSWTMRLPVSRTKGVVDPCTSFECVQASFPEMCVQRLLAHSWITRSQPLVASACGLWPKTGKRRAVSTVHTDLSRSTPGAAGGLRELPHQELRQGARPTVTAVCVFNGHPARLLVHAPPLLTVAPFASTTIQASGHQKNRK